LSIFYVNHKFLGKEHSIPCYVFSKHNGVFLQYRNIDLAQIHATHRGRGEVGLPYWGERGVALSGWSVETSEIGGLAGHLGGWLSLGGSLWG
jgi:hypothetical protein